jgi:putative ABC transport system permease protein
MKIRDAFSYSFGAIRLRKLRAGLTILGVVIGIAAIAALLSITQGLQNTITTQLQEGLAADTLVVIPGGGFFSGDQDPGGGFGPGMGGSNSGFQLQVNDTEIIEDLSPDILMASATIQRQGYINSSEQNDITTIVGVEYSEYQQIYGTTFVAESGQISPTPVNDSVVIGKRLNQLQNGTVVFALGEDVQISWTNATARPPMNETYAGKVTAVLQEVGGFAFGGPSDDSIYIPQSQAEAFFDTAECQTIIVKLAKSDQATIDQVSQLIIDEFAGEVSVISATAVVSLLGSVFSIIQIFLVGIAAISLLVAGIGIMNIMIVSLIERTREIGILKALGMRNQTVMLIFLGESIIIGTIGATIGIALGYGLANVVAVLLGGGGAFSGMGGASAVSDTSSLKITPILTPTVFAGAFAFGIGISVIFALYPAWRASKLKPVDALRYE